MMVKVGLALPAVGKTEALATARLGMAWQRRSGPTTEVEGLVPIRVEPEGWAQASARSLIGRSVSRAPSVQVSGQRLSKPERCQYSARCLIVDWKVRSSAG